jgi:hypothetical protein
VYARQGLKLLVYARQGLKLLVYARQVGCSNARDLRICRSGLVYKALSH